MALGDFQRTVIMIALIILVIILLVTGYLMYNQKPNSGRWPPYQSNCPDYWMDTDGTGKNCINSQNLGNCGSKTMNFTVAPFVGNNGACGKYNWAKGCNLSWDGVTYGVKNPCVNA
jgi:hypothetical protein